MRYNLRATRGRKKRVRFWDNRNNLVRAAAMASFNQTNETSDIVLGPLIDIETPPPADRPPVSVHDPPSLNVRVLSGIGSPLGSSSRNPTPIGSHADLGGVQLTQTPLGGGAATALNIPPINLLPNRPSKQHLQNRISIVRYELNGFERSCEDEVGWIGELELNLARIGGSIIETRSRCVERMSAPALYEFLVSDSTPSASV